MTINCGRCAAHLPAHRAHQARGERAFPRQARATSPAGGFVLWVELPPGSIRSHFMKARCARHQHRAGLMFFRLGPRYRNCVRLNYWLRVDARDRARAGAVGDLAKAQLARPVARQRTPHSDVEERVVINSREKWMRFVKTVFRRFSCCRGFCIRRARVSQTTRPGRQVHRPAGWQHQPLCRLIAQPLRTSGRGSKSWWTTAAAPMASSAPISAPERRPTAIRWCSACRRARGSESGLCRVICRTSF